MDIYATELMGAKTYDVAGNYVGRVREFFIEPAEAPNRVSLTCYHGAIFNRWWPTRPGCVGGGGEDGVKRQRKALALYEPNESWLAFRRICWINRSSIPRPKGRACK